MSTRISRVFRLASVAGLASLSCVAVALTGGCSSDSNSGTPAGTGGASTGGSSAGGSSAGGASNGGKSGSGGLSSSGGASGGGGGGNACTGGPVTSPVDDHCAADSGPVVQATGACVSDSADAGSGAADAGPEEETPGPWGGTSSADDDCKYDVSYTVTPICEGQDVTFIVTLKSRVDHSAVTGASPELEVLDPNGIPAAEGSQTPTETSPGVYKITPITFNKKGKWTVRFHFFEACSDAPEDSPHGHAAFFIDVP